MSSSQSWLWWIFLKSFQVLIRGRDFESTLDLEPNSCSYDSSYSNTTFDLLEYTYYIGVNTVRNQCNLFIGQAMIPKFTIAEIVKIVFHDSREKKWNLSKSLLFTSPTVLSVLKSRTVGLYPEYLNKKKKKWWILQWYTSTHHSKKWEHSLKKYSYRLEVKPCVATYYWIQLFKKKKRNTAHPLRDFSQNERFVACLSIVTNFCMGANSSF